MKASEQLWSCTLEENPEENEATLGGGRGRLHGGLCSEGWQSGSTQIAKGEREMSYREHVSFARG